MSRIEALSDGVFALTITLLVVSASAPKSFYDLWIMVRDLPAFIMSFALILMAWYYHYLYFRRYGLEDFQTMILNSIFLFIVMFFAYPLKFLSTFLWFLVIGEDVQQLFIIPEYASSMIISGNDVINNPSMQRIAMMYLYSFGVLGVFGTLTVMQIRALLMKDILELDSLEIAITKKSIYHHSIDVLIASISLVVLASTSNPGFSGIVYFSIPLCHSYFGWYQGSKIRKIKQELIHDESE